MGALEAMPCHAMRVSGVEWKFCRQSLAPFFLVRAETRAILFLGANFSSTEFSSCRSTQLVPCDQCITLVSYGVLTQLYEMGGALVQDSLVPRRRVSSRTFFRAAY